MKLFSWNIIYFGQKQPIEKQIVRLLNAPMKVHLIAHAIFETARSGFIQILHHCSVSWKITPLYFCILSFVYFGQKELKSVFTYALHHPSVSWEITLLYFFSSNFIWFGKKEPIKVQNFRLSTAHMKFHQICTLIGSCCWKYKTFLLKKV